MEVHNCQRRIRIINYWSFKFRAESFGTERVSEWRRSWGGENFGELKASEWQNAISGWKCLRDGGQLWEGRMWWRVQDGFWELWMPQWSPLVVWTHVVILVRVKFWPLQIPPTSPLVRTWGREVEGVKLIEETLNALSSLWRLWTEECTMNLFESSWIFWS